MVVKKGPKGGRSGGIAKPPVPVRHHDAQHKLYIRNMVCDRCKTVLRALLAAQGVQPVSIELGEVTLAVPLTIAQKAQLDADLKGEGFERIDDRKSRIIERTKRLLRERARGDAMARTTKVNLSVELSDALSMEYSGLSKLFSSVEGMTIERYFNLQRLERAKELLVYDEMSLSQIADELGYSSIQHLSNQFAQYVGMSPSHFKKLGAIRRRTLDHVGP